MEHQQQVSSAQIRREGEKSGLGPAIGDRIAPTKMGLVGRVKTIQREHAPGIRHDPIRESRREEPGDEIRNLLLFGNYMLEKLLVHNQF